MRIYINIKYISLCEDMGPKGKHLVLHDRHQAPDYLFCFWFYIKNGPGEALGRWVPTSRFENSNRELLALCICRAVAVFVVHKGSLEVPGGPRGPGGVSGTSSGGPRGPRGVPRGPRGVPGVLGACPGDPRDPRELQGHPRHPRDPFHKGDSVNLFYNITR